MIFVVHIIGATLPKLRFPVFAEIAVIVDALEVDEIGYAQPGVVLQGVTNPVDCEFLLLPVPALVENEVDFIDVGIVLVVDWRSGGGGGGGRRGGAG